MNICVAGWHYGPGIDTLKAAGGFVVSHKPHPLADVVIPNVGLEFGCYDWYLKNQVLEHPVLFTHDDNEFDEYALEDISKLEVDQAFLFSSEAEAKRNGYAHGRAIFCGTNFVRKLRDDGGFWYDESSGGAPATTTAPDYHNNGIQMFRAYLQGCDSGMTVGGYRIIEGMKLSYRGGEEPAAPPPLVRLNLACGQMILPDYTNVDLYPGTGVDLACDIRHLPYSENTVDEILLIHAIEHFSLDDAIALLQSLRKLLKNGGKLVIEAPDVYKAVRSGKPQMEAIIGIFGDVTELRKGKAAYQHLWGWTGELMRDALTQVGFRSAHLTDGTTHDRPWRDFRIEAVK